MKKDWSMLIRVITVAPILATVFLLCMLLHRFDVFANLWQWLYYLVFLGLLPLLAYPLQRFFPHFQNEGRRGQRTLAMIFAVAGYLLCCGLNFFFAASPGAWVIVLEYLLSGAAITLWNQAFGVKISGHACGICGPVALLFYFGLPVQALCGILIMVLVYISSLRTKRHTLPQLIGGSVVPIVIIVVLKLLFG